MASLPPELDLNGDFAGNDSSVTYAEGDPITSIAPEATVSDADSADFEEGSLTVAFTAGGTAEDQLRIVGGDFSVEESDLYYQGVPIGAITGGTDGSTPLVVNFYAGVTADIAAALVRAIGYVSFSGALSPENGRSASRSPTATAEPASRGWPSSPSRRTTLRRWPRTTPSSRTRTWSRPEACSRTMEAGPTAIPTGRP